MNNKIIVKGKFRPEIEGLRAFSVIAVIINHFNKDILPSGYLGVDIFFVISGYVITSSLAARKTDDFRQFLTGFFERRVKRLIPALLPFTLITGLLISFFNPYPGISLITGITSLFGLSNLYLLDLSTDYFADSTLLNAFTHTWSLDVEEQFYIIFPLIVWFTGFGRKSINSNRNLLITIIILITLSLTSYIYIYQFNQSAAYFLMPTRFWEMAFGCLTFLLIDKYSPLKFKQFNFNSFYILVSIVLVLFFPVSKSLLATIFIVLLSSFLIFSLKKDYKFFNLFVNKFSLHIGKL